MVRFHQHRYSYTRMTLFRFVKANFFCPSINSINRIASLNKIYKLKYIAVNVLLMALVMYFCFIDFVEGCILIYNVLRGTAIRQSTASVRIEVQNAHCAHRVEGRPPEKVSVPQCFRTVYISVGSIPVDRNAVDPDVQKPKVCITIIR